MLGFTSEFQTHNPEFDQRFYIFSDDPQLCAKLRAPSIQTAIKRIFDAGSKKIEVSDNGQLVVHMKKAAPVPDPLTADIIVQAVHEIGDQVKTVTLAPNSQCLAIKKQANTAIYVMIVALIAGAMAAFIRPYAVTALEPLLRNALLYAVPMIIALLLIIRSQFRHSSRGILVFVTALFAGIPAIYALSFTGLYYSNIYMDDSPTELHYVKITDTYTTRNKNKTFYHLKVQDWQNPSHTVHFSVKYPFYSAARVNAYLLLHTHMGYWDVPWIEHYEHAQ